jgi:hypothetical protein
MNICITAPKFEPSVLCDLSNVKTISKRKNKKREKEEHESTEW